MPRLPNPGGDQGQWGQILNDYLAQSHNADGSLKSSAVTAAGAGTYSKPVSGIPKADLSSTVQASLDNADAAAAGTVPDATSSVKGKLQLTGDLAGTAASPAIAAGAVSTAKLADSAVTDSKVSSSAAIAQSKVANLTTDLAGKASTTHTHAASDITSGTIATARLGSGTANSTTYLRGDGAWAAPSTSGGNGPAQILDSGNLGATYTLDVAQAARTQFTGVLTANLTLTVVNIPAGGEIVLLLAQDATGSRAATISFGGNTQLLDVASSPNANTVIFLHSPDAADLFISGGVPAGSGSSVLLSTVQSKGDLIVGTGSAAVNRLAAGTNGQILTADSTQATGLRWSTVSGGGSSSLADYGMFPWTDPNVVAENRSREISGNINQVITQDGMLRLFPAVKLKAGQTYSGISFVTQGTGATSPTMQWACILSYPARVILAVSPDYTTTAWGNAQRRIFTFNTPYTPGSDQLVYGGLCITATGHPGLLAVSSNSALNGSAGTSQICGFSNSGLTGPLAVGVTVNAPGAATTGSTNAVPYIAMV